MSNILCSKCIALLSQDFLPVEISGATGSNAELINGTHTPIEKRLNGMTIYPKLEKWIILKYHSPVHFFLKAGKSQTTVFWVRPTSQLSET